MLPLRFSGWSTLAIAAAAVTAFVWPGLAPVLVYDRNAILHGELWRLWTGHVVHFSASHMWWNLAVVVPAGLMLEHFASRMARWFWVWAPLVISGALFVGQPALALYGGLSGLAMGLVVLLALNRLGRDPSRPHWFWPAVLLLAVAKVGAEITTQTPLLAHFGGQVRTVPLAHLAGAACGMAAGRETLFSRRN